MRLTIDLNCDLGERPEAIADGTEEALLDCVSSVNVACGGHAGDRATMAATVRSARARGVAVGAHPGYPDRAGFGRREMALSPDEIAGAVAVQVLALAGVASRLGAALVHVKPHGALYSRAMRDGSVAAAIADGVARVRRDLILVGLAGSPALEAWRRLGFATASEAFADRLYEPDGTLRSRSLDGALIVAPEEAAEQAVRIAEGRGIVASDGTEVRLRAETICLHGDTPGALAIAREVRRRLEGAGIGVRSLAGA